jgi:anti-sigma B factor antagonist
MDSCGIGELVTAYSTITIGGGQLKLLSPTRPVHYLLNITKLYAAFETYDNEAAAIRSFSIAQPAHAAHAAPDIRSEFFFG